MKSVSLSPSLCLLVTFLSGVIILLPSLIFQDLLSQTDHGKDLYGFAMTAQGGVPYRDYLWVYGPLMPYYYALFLKCFGASIASVLLGETLLKFACGLIFFAAMRQMTTVVWATLSTVYFWAFFPYFFHTYNHTGGILFILLTVWSLVKYIRTRNQNYLYWGSLAVFLLTLIKLNFGICTGVWYAIAVFTTDRSFCVPLKDRKLPYGLFLMGLPVLTLLIYSLLTRGLPDYVLNQCFPFTKTGGQYSITLTQLPGRIFTFLWLFATSSWRDMVFLGFCIFSTIGYVLTCKKIDPAVRKPVNLTLCALWLLFLFLSHEFVLSGLHYRLIWAMEILFLAVFMMAHHVLAVQSRVIEVIVSSLLILLILNKVDLNFKYVQAHARPEYFLATEKGGILLGNEPEWVKTVVSTVGFLKNNLAKDEYFVAVPADPLYYFLLDQRSPTYQLVFTDFNMISQAQDRQTVADLQQKNIRWIVMSNFIKLVDPTVGEFGVTNSPQLAQYIRENFYPVASFGPWEKAPRWNINHATMILKKK